jgi:hypothetical protein
MGQADPGDLVGSFPPGSGFFQGWTLFVVFAGAGVIAAMFVNGVPSVGVLGGLAVAAALVARYVQLRRNTPTGGWPSYLVFTDGLVVKTDTDRLLVRWEEVDLVWHRPLAVEGTVTYQASYPDYCELALAGRSELLRIAGARRQSVLSGLIVDSTRPRILNRLLREFERGNGLRLGRLTVSPDGVRDDDGHHLAWGGDWQFRKIPRADGWQLVVRGARQGDRRMVAGLVPEPTVAIELLETLARSRAG